MKVYSVSHSMTYDFDIVESLHKTLESAEKQLEYLVEDIKSVTKCVNERTGYTFYVVDEDNDEEYYIEEYDLHD